MSRIAAIAMFVLATAMTSSSASARHIKVVPFELDVNNNSRPAGTGALGFDSVVHRLLTIQGRMNSEMVMDLAMRVLIGPGKLRTLTFQDLPKQPPPPNQFASPRSGEQRRFSLYFEIVARVLLCVVISWPILYRWTDADTKAHQFLTDFSPRRGITSA